MFANYIKIALRNLIRHKGYSFINISGLAIGITSAILIMLYVQDELSYDKFYEDHDRIYRLSREWFDQDGVSSLHLARVAPPVAYHLKDEYSHLFEHIGRALSDYETLISIGEKTFIEDEFYWADNDLIHVFGLDIIKGDPENPLKDAATIILSESMAKRYFGDEDPIGKAILYENEHEIFVTGVFRDIPENTHFKYDALASMETMKNLWGEDFFRQHWGRNSFLTYIKLRPNVPAGELASVFPDLFEKYYRAQLKNWDVEIPDDVKLSETNKLHLWKLTDIHLKSHLETEIEPNGDINNIYIFSLVAVFIILIACINFMNLATARSSKRAKEIGMRKVLGAYRKQLIYQFLGESVMISMISLVIAVLLVEMLLPAFNGFVLKDLSFNILGDPILALQLLGIVLFVGIVAGSYPALFLSGFRPVKILKGERAIGTGTSVLRRVLVVGQFAVTIALFVSVAVVYQQMQFLNNKKLGFNKDQIIVLSTNTDLREAHETVKTRLKENPNIESVTFSSLVPSDNLVNSWGGRRIDGDRREAIKFRLAVVEADHDFTDTYEMEILAGRYHKREFATDSTAWVINEAAVNALGFDNMQDVIGMPFEYGGTPGTIIGVVNNINFESLHSEVSPQLHVLSLGRGNVSIRVNTANLQATISHIEKIWKEYRPDHPFEYEFLDELFADLYRTEQQLGQIFGVFSVLAIIIACLGLLGLASYTAEQKTKEIGIRKTLGASISSIILMFIKEFAKLVVIANLAAWPLAYYGMRQWLGTFAYSIDLGFGLFVIAGVAALAIALFTVSFQAIKASLSNPINSLRYE